MEEYKKLKSKINEETYKELELFWVNNTNFTEAQAKKLVNILEKISQYSKKSGSFVKNKKPFCLN